MECWQLLFFRCQLTNLSLSEKPDLSKHGLHLGKIPLGHQCGLAHHHRLDHLGKVGLHPDGKEAQVTRIPLKDYTFICEYSLKWKALPSPSESGLASSAVKWCSVATMAIGHFNYAFGFEVLTADRMASRINVLPQLPCASICKAVPHLFANVLHLQESSWTVEVYIEI